MRLSLVAAVPLLLLGCATEVRTDSVASRSSSVRPPSASRPSSDSTQASSGATSHIPTYEEYYQSALDAAACISDRGVPTQAVEDANGSISLQSSANVVSEVQYDAIYEACVSQNLRAVQDAYLATIRPSEDEAYATLRACLIDLGVLQPDVTDRALIMAAVEAVPADDQRKTPAEICITTAFVG